MQKQRNGHLLIAGTLVILILMALITPVFSAEFRLSLMDEGGFFENLTVVVYCFSVLLFAYMGGIKALKQHWYVPIILLFFAAREQDLDKSLFTHGIYKTRQYFGGGVEPLEMLISGSILVLVLLSLYILVRYHYKPWVQNIRNGSAVAIAVLIGILLIAITRTFDKLTAIFGGAEGRWPGYVIEVIVNFEELGELGIAIMFTLAIFLAFRRANHIS